MWCDYQISSAPDACSSKILVLEYGELIEVGTHLELMQRKGRYYELFSTQAKRYVTEGEAVLEEVPANIRPNRPPMPDGAGKRPKE